METPGALPLSGDFEFQALAEARNYRNALLEEFRPYLKGDILEIGAGIGQFTETVRPLDALRRLVSVEMDKRLCALFRERHPGFELVEGTVADLPAGTEGDAILSINVLEHIREDAAELAAYRNLLARRGGHLCLFVPARPELYAPIDRDFGHIRRYTRDGLKRLLREAGFDIVRLDYFNSVGYVTWWILFRLLKKRHFDPGAIRLFDRVIFPVAHALESRVCRPPFGQSLLAVARAFP
jgi:SAM-dependent methyltransferase